MHNYYTCVYAVNLMYTGFSLCEESDVVDCHDNATCTDLEGGFECECVTGYTGNGTQCDGKVRQNPLLHANIYNSIMDLLS